ncbi:MAG TPA: 30S ribosomal protein S6 [Solirubrobacterales bacterium]|nr:30S ribosomal protein S6 [Solirubrobacterales bacterium]
MAAQREYELVLMLDPGRDAAGRDAAAQEAKKMIEASGSLKHENEWGLRKLAYEIEQRNEADYRWYRFEAPSELLDQLNHSLKIAEGVLRFRIFKVDADAPVMVPPATAAPGPGASRERSTATAPRSQAESEPAAAAEPAPSEAPAAVAEPPAESPAEPEAAVAEPEAAEPAAEPTPESSAEDGDDQAPAAVE